MHTDCGIAGVMRGELTKKRESTFPPSGFWDGGLGKEVGPVLSLVGAQDGAGCMNWNWEGMQAEKHGEKQGP